MHDLITKDDILRYAESNGKRAAANLLLLAGPDGYDGSYAEYEKLMEEMEGQA